MMHWTALLRIHDSWATHVAPFALLDAVMSGLSLHVFDRLVSSGAAVRTTGVLLSLIPLFLFLRTGMFTYTFVIAPFRVVFGNLAPSPPSFRPGPRSYLSFRPASLSSH